MSNYGGIPVRSLYVHAKTYLNFFNNYSTSNTLHVSNYALIFNIYGSSSIVDLQLASI
jgi:hypothetical protein